MPTGDQRADPSSSELYGTVVVDDAPVQQILLHPSREQVGVIAHAHGGEAMREQRAVGHDRAVTLLASHQHQQGHGGHPAHGRGADGDRAPAHDINERESLVDIAAGRVDVKPQEIPPAFEVVHQDRINDRVDAFLADLCAQGQDAFCFEGISVHCFLLRF